MKATMEVGRALLRAQSDARLVELAGAGQETAFEAIVERYRPALHRYCRRLLSDTAAEDAVQQAFLNAWSGLRSGTEVRELRPWLYRIAHNAMLRIVARNGEGEAELPEWLGGAPSAAANFEQKLDMHATFAALAELPERQRDALVGTAIHGRSREELAGVLGLTEGAVRQLVHRARLALRTAITAITPLPLVLRLMSRAREASLAPGATEIGAGAGSAGVATAAFVKWGAVISVTGMLAAAPVVTHGGGEVAPAKVREVAAATNERAAPASATEPRRAHRIDPKSGPSRSKSLAEAPAPKSAGAQTVSGESEPADSRVGPAPATEGPGDERTGAGAVPVPRTTDLEQPREREGTNTLPTKVEPLPLPVLPGDVVSPIKETTPLGDALRGVLDSTRGLAQ